MVSAASMAALLGCGDDDDGSGTSTTVIPLSEMTVDQANEAILDYASDRFPDAEWLDQIEVTELDANTVVLGPTPGNELDIDQAAEICTATTTVIYRSLPTADVTVRSSGGDVLADNSGAAGSCVTA